MAKWGRYDSQLAGIIAKRIGIIITTEVYTYKYNGQGGRYNFQGIGIKEQLNGKIKMTTGGWRNSRN